MLVYGCLQWYNSLDSVLWLFYQKINGFCRNIGDSDPLHSKWQPWTYL